MKMLKLVALAALAIAVIGPPAAIAASGTEAKSAFERAAPAPLVDLGPAQAVQPIGAPLAGGGKLDVIAPAIPAEARSGALPRTVAAAGVLVDRDPVAYPLLL